MRACMQMPLRPEGGGRKSRERGFLSPVAPAELFSMPSIRTEVMPDTVVGIGESFKRSQFLPFFRHQIKTVSGLF